MAAEVLAAAGLCGRPLRRHALGRPQVPAGRQGRAEPHAREPLPTASSARYGERRRRLEALLADFDAAAVRAWARGWASTPSSAARAACFPADMKAAPLLRAWLHRLRDAGRALPHAPPLAGLGGRRARCASTPRPGERCCCRPRHRAGAGRRQLGALGSDGAWVPLLAARGVAVAPLLPANCGFDVGWSEHRRASRFAGAAAQVGGAPAPPPTGFTQQGEFVVTATGVEGSLVYAASALLREAIAAHGRPRFTLDLLPDRERPGWRRGGAPARPRSLGTHLKSRLNLGRREGRRCCTKVLPRARHGRPGALAAAIKALPITLLAPRGPSTRPSAAPAACASRRWTRGLMLQALPGVFCAGEMLDWEAPTGGYLLTACLASGR
jgi:uncharacterized flavoprotein (TIGR03862 family)